MVQNSIFFALLNPIVALFVVVVFSLTWLRWPHYRHLPALALAFLSLGVAFVLYDFRLLVWPGEVNLGSNVLYIAAVTLACCSTMLRKNQRLPFMLFSAVMVAGALPFGWFLLVEPSLEARIMITSGIFAAVTSITFVRLVWPRERSLADNLFAAGVGVAFFIAVFRPALVAAGLLAIDGPNGFTSSDYWLSIRAFTPVMSFIVATLFAVAIGLDIVNHLKGQADRDYLTGLLNRRGFETAGSERLTRDVTASRQPAMIIADIDDFKKVNDNFGHKAGDAVIASVARVLANHGRALLSARVGGEEFALYYNDVGRTELQDIARTIRAELEQTDIPGLPDDFRVTLSMGVHLSYSVESLGEMMARADQALYRAKREGKDKAVMTPVQLHLATRTAAPA